MNRRISFFIAGAAIAAALAGCGSHLAPGAQSSPSWQVTSSAVKSEAAQAGRVILSACIPAKDITQAYLISLATSGSEREALAGKCRIPQENVKPFVKAVLISAGNAWMKGTFKTTQGRQEWADQVFPVILKTYQAKQPS